MKRIAPVFFTLVFVTAALTAFSQSASEQIYIQRLASLKSPVDMTYHPEIKKHIDAYLANTQRTQEMLSLCKVYFPMIEKKKVLSTSSYSDLNEFLHRTIKLKFPLKLTKFNSEFSLDVRYLLRAECRKGNG